MNISLELCCRAWPRLAKGDVAQGIQDGNQILHQDNHRSALARGPVQHMDTGIWQFITNTMPSADGRQRKSRHPAAQRARTTYRPKAIPIGLDSGTGFGCRAYACNKAIVRATTSSRWSALSHKDHSRALMTLDINTRRDVRQGFRSG